MYSVVLIGWHEAPYPYIYYIIKQHYFHFCKQEVNVVVKNSDKYTDNIRISIEIDPVFFFLSLFYATEYIFCCLYKA